MQHDQRLNVRSKRTLSRLLLEEMHRCLAKRPWPAFACLPRISVTAVYLEIDVHVYHNPVYKLHHLSAPFQGWQAASSQVTTGYAAAVNEALIPRT